MQLKLVVVSDDEDGGSTREGSIGTAGAQDSRKHFKTFFRTSTPSRDGAGAKISHNKKELKTQSMINRNRYFITRFARLFDN